MSQTAHGGAHGYDGPAYNAEGGIAVKRPTSPTPPRHATAEREIELKFQVPVRAQHAVEQALRLRAPRAQQLRARYHDTADGRLSASGLSLRLRNEDGRWLQTLKAQDAHGPFGRLEHNVDLGARARAPRLVPARHDGTPAGAALRLALQGAQTPLLEVYRTEVLRLSCLLDVGDDRVELAFDRGVLRAGSLEQPISELEFELVWGDVQALPPLTRDWIVKHGLWLQSESKAARGERLRQRRAAAVVKAGTPRLERGLSAHAVLRAVLRSCLAQVVPNASAIAEGSTASEHVHQLRVGLRRLRTALRELGALVPDSGLAALEAPLVAVFRQLGQLRDQQAVLDAIKPRLLRAGAQGVAWAERPGSTADAAASVHEAAFQCALVQLLAFALAEDEAPQRANDDVERHIRERLRTLHKQVLRDGKDFAKLSTHDQHRVRKRLKRLRYLSEFVASLYPPAEGQAYLHALHPAQDELGAHNDLVVASLIAREAAQQADPDARFALTWLGQQRAKAEKRSRRAIERIAAAEPFWKRGGKKPPPPPGP